MANKERRLSLRYFGDPILRKRAQKVELITNDIRRLIEDMIASIFPPYDVGISAPQVGESLRIFVINVDGEDEDGNPIFGAPRVFINPILSHPSEEEILIGEGCLSIPHVFGDVWRPESVVVEALDEKGLSFKEEFHGYVARVIMHENDHLNGVLFIDRLSPNERKRIDPKLQEIKKKHKNA